VSGLDEVQVVGFALSPRPAPLANLLRDLWRARDLIVVLSRRNFFTRYRRTSFGLLWAVGLPLVQAVVMAVIFHYAVRVDVPHYPVFVFAGLFVWSFFSTAVLSGSTAIVDGTSLASRIYFPRAVLPIVTVAGNIYTFVVTIGLLVIAEVLFGVRPGWNTLLLVPAAALAVLLTLVLSLLLSAVHVYFRDVRYIVQAAMTAWFYLTPVFYPLHFLDGVHAPSILGLVVRANPVTGVVELFRVATTGADPGWPVCVAITCVWTVALAVCALEVHRRRDRLFTDLL
jgi:ABC-type polysaccharide/polyol phosphate export permease